MFEERKFVKIHCSIYDKWGSEVYTNEEGEELKWDGMYRGQQVSSGVYTYIMDIVKDDGSLEKVYGTITITR
jgi:gliding motility-associated-like protein